MPTYISIGSDETSPNSAEMRCATSSVDPVDVPKKIPTEGDAKRETDDRIFAKKTKNRVHVFVRNFDTFTP
jgi:hypothetical protein